MADPPWPRVQALTLFRTMRRQHIEPDAVCYEVGGAHAPHAPRRTRARTHARTHARTAPHARTHARTHARICTSHRTRSGRARAAARGGAR